MAHLGTGVQIAAVGAQNEFLDLGAEVTYFKHKVQRSTRFASEACEHRPLQTAGFGRTAVFELPPRGDLLGDMHVQFRIPAVQAALGESLPPVALPPLVGPAVAAPSVPDVAMQGFVGVPGTSRLFAQGIGRGYVFESGGVRWEVAVHADGRRVSTLTGGGAGEVRTLTVAGATFPQRAGTTVAVLVTDDGVVSANDTWEDKLAYVLMRRVRFVVDDLVIHDHERLWYDLYDRLTEGEGHVAGKAQLLGSGLSMAEPHTVVLPLKFMCCSTRGTRAYFPVALVPTCRVRVELQVEAFGRCARSSRVPSAEPASMDALLVVEHLTLDREERNAMLLRGRAMLMYESAQDMDGLNYVESSDGAPTYTRQVGVDLSELNLPVRALVWVVYTESTPRLFEYLDMVEEATLQFGSLERATADGPTLARQQLWTHAPRCQAGNVSMYSFALHAWAAEPSGAVDFSLVAKPTLRLRLKPAAEASQLKSKVFGTTFNWLTFQNGTVARLFST